MSVAIMLAGALFAQSTAGFTVPAPSGDVPDVGYAELVRGHPAEAIEHIRASGALDQRDPTAYINLGTAYALLGRQAEAQRAYLDARTTAARYDVELSDGRWMDSRDAARMAARALENGQILALR